MPPRRDLARALGIAVAGALAYLPALGAGFVFDDHQLVERSALLDGPLWRIWFTADAQDYWPLTYTSLFVERRLWGDWAAGYHAVNVALHLTAALLVVAALRRLRTPGAWAAGALFALHPVAVESVAWISERKNTMSGCLFLGAILAWLAWDEGRRGRDYALALLLFLLALLAKTSVVMLPVVLLGIATWRRGRVTRHDVAAAAPFFLLSAAFGALTAWFQWTRVLGTYPLQPRGMLERLGGAGWAWLTYLRQAFVPVDLAFAQPPWPVRPGSPVFFVPLAVVAAGFGALWALRRRPWGRAALLAAGWHGVMVLPVLGILDMAWLVIGPTADHLQYLALLGPVTLVAAGTARLRGAIGRRAFAVIGLAALALVGVMTFRRAGTFRDDLTLWRAAAADAPQSLVAAWKLTDELGSRGRRDEAMAQLGAAVERFRAPEDRERLRSVFLLYSGDLPRAVDVAIAVQREAPDRPYWAAFMARLRYLLRNGTAAEAAGLLARCASVAP